MKDHLLKAWQIGIDNFVSLIILTLVLAAASILSIGILFPVAFAGYVWSVQQLALYNREPKAQDIFCQMRLFLPLFVFTLIIFIVSAIGFTLFILPGFLFTIIVGYTCLYVIPLMVDKQFGLVDAIKKSISMVTGGNVGDHIAVFLIFYALTTIGGSSFVGFIVLQPLATLFLLSVYQESF